MLLTIAMVIILLAIVTGVIFKHNQMKELMRVASDIDVRLVREAAEHSVRASNSKNIILALVECTNAIRIIEDIVRRYGATQASQITNVDLSAMLGDLTEQNTRIMNHFSKKHADILPHNILHKYQNFTHDRNEMRQKDTEHLAAEEEEEDGLSSDF
jgi:hypothetical protein